MGPYPSLAFVFYRQDADAKRQCINDREFGKRANAFIGNRHIVVGLPADDAA
ncbi:hypothetical protein D3C71_2075440 [compost metagenome]